MLYTWNHINRGRVWRAIYNFISENQLNLRLEMWCGCTSIFVTCFLYLQGKQLFFCFLFSLSLCSLWCVQNIGYIVAWNSYSNLCTLHYLITCIFIVQICLNIWHACQLYATKCVFKIESILSLAFKRHVEMGILSWPNSHLMILRIFVSYYHRQVGNMNL